MINFVSGFNDGIQRSIRENQMITWTMNTIILMGDYCQTNMKRLEPSKGKSIRRLFTRHEYKLYLVNEFRTSCRMFDNGVEMETFKKTPKPKPL